MTLTYYLDDRSTMEPYPASPEPEPTTQTRGTAPESVRTAVKLIWANIALGVLSALVTFVLLDNIVDTALEGTSGLDRDAAQLSVIGGTIVGLVVSVGLAALFAYFISKGANWARIIYTVLTVLGILLSLLGLLSTQPVILLLLSVVGLALSVAILFFLYRPDSNAYFKGTQLTR